MFPILWRLALALMFFSIVLIAASYFLAPSVNEKDYIVYHVPRRYEEGYNFYLHDRQRHIRIKIPHLPCAKEIMPEALTGSTGRYLFVDVEDNRLVIVDSYWGVVCRL